MFNKKTAIGGVLLIIIAIVLLIVLKKPSDEPRFRKDSEMYFFDSDTGKKITTIDIEVADDYQERTQGLMYRKSMPKNAGMLFIFPKMTPQAFWMKNTHISLDIIYVDDQGVIVSIAENTEPFSEKQIPSGKPAIYVVEVNAGFSKMHGIEAGDKIGF